MRVYVGCPIDQCGQNPLESMSRLIDLVNGAAAVLSSPASPPIIYNPLSAWSNAHLAEDAEDLDFVYGVNQKALLDADLGVFLWNGSPSFGIPVEIAAAKRALVVNTSGKMPGLYLKRAVLSKGAIVSFSWDAPDVAEFNKFFAEVLSLEE